MPISVWVCSAGEGLHLDLHNRNRIPQAGTLGWRQRAACTKRTISIALPLCPSSPLELPQASLRDPVSIFSLCSERSVHHGEWILSLLLPEDQGITVKQNKTEKITYYIDSPPPQPHLNPSLLWNRHAWSVCYPTGSLPITQIPLNFDFLHLNPVLRLLKCMQLLACLGVLIQISAFKPSFSLHILLFSLHHALLLSVFSETKLRHKHSEDSVWYCANIYNSDDVLWLNKFEIQYVSP